MNKKAWLIGLVFISIASAYGMETEMAIETETGGQQKSAEQAQNAQLNPTGSYSPSSIIARKSGMRYMIKCVQQQPPKKQEKHE